MTVPPRPWLYQPAARWRVQAADAGVYLIILTTTLGTTAWAARWIPLVGAWGHYPRVATAPGHALAQVLSGAGLGNADMINSWPWLAPCILLNAWLLWGGLILLRSPRVPLGPVAVWLALAAMATTAAARWLG